jgi:hypothetical protein
LVGYESDVRIHAASAIDILLDDSCFIFLVTGKR